MSSRLSESRAVGPSASAAERARLRRLSAREMGVMMGLAALVGLASAVAAVVLYRGIHFAIQRMEPLHGSAWMVVMPGAGAALAAFFLNTWLKDEAGHGVPELIHSATVGGGRLRLDLTYSRLVSSLLTVGSGGSAGLEGPAATSGGAIGSAIAHLFRFNERRRTLLLGCGVAGAVAAIFNAPLTGTVFALEVILGEWSALAILPTIVSAVAATQFSRLILGNQIAFPHTLQAFTTLDLTACLVLGVFTGLLSVAFQRGLRLTEHHSGRWIPTHWLRAGLGGLLVGGIGFFNPSVLHDGYLSVQDFLNGVTAFSIVGLAAFLALKLIACCLTLGSGGSGGVFAPSLVLGSAAGFMFGKVLQQLFPGWNTASPSAFALVGMSGMVAGLMHAPLTGMFLVLEVTSGYGLILPLMIVSVLAMITGFFFEKGSVYTRELIGRGLLARRGSDVHLLQTMEPRELIDPEDLVLHEGMLLGEFVEIFKRAKRNVFPVIERGS
ncbi:MAG TPA: chloride channel protein, partial [bacterium]